MKRARITGSLLGVCLFLGLAPAAFAFDSVEAAYAGMIRAGQSLTAQAEDAMAGEAPDLASDLGAALAGFAEIAAKASAAMDAHDGPADLRCIYRGMAEDAAKHARELAAAGDSAARLAKLEDIRFLADDAVLVTPEIMLAEADDPLAGLPPMECAASQTPLQASDLAAFF